MTVLSTRERWSKEKRLEDLPRRGLKPMLDAKQESLLVAFVHIVGNILGLIVALITGNIVLS